MYLGPNQSVESSESFQETMELVDDDGASPTWLERKNSLGMKEELQMTKKQVLPAQCNNIDECR